MPAASDELPRTFGPYTLLERLGQGGMAEVFLARQEVIEGIQRLVALKRVHPSLTRDQGFVDMFRDEVRIVSQLSHPNIGHILDAGEVGGQWYLAMEYVQGRDLARVITAAERGDGLPVSLTVEIGRQLCAALDHAHNRTDASGQPLHIVHRDLTPDNVILTFDGTVKLVDFGIATAASRVSHTQSGMLKGKPPYMAPEQVLGESVDARADLFGLGVLLYRMVTGTHPFLAGSPDETFRRVVERSPAAPSTLVPDLPPGLSRLILQAMAKNPARRVPSARAFQDALDEVVVSTGSMVTPRWIAEWLLARFPDVAAARESLRQDPSDHLAALTVSYLAPAPGVGDWEDDGAPTRPELPDLDRLATTPGRRRLGGAVAEAGGTARFPIPDDDPEPATEIADALGPARIAAAPGADGDDDDEPETVVAPARVDVPAPRPPDPLDEPRTEEASAVRPPPPPPAPRPGPPTGSSTSAPPPGTPGAPRPRRPPTPPSAPRAPAPSPPPASTAPTPRWPG